MVNLKTTYYFQSQTSDGGFKAYLEENRVPPMFLFMLILQFTLIIIDRAIYLRRNILGKLIFQFIQIVILHIWLFILFPVITEKYVTCNPLQTVLITVLISGSSKLLYLLKCTTWSNVFISYCLHSKSVADTRLEY